MKTVGKIAGFIWIVGAIFAGAGFLTKIDALSGIGSFLFSLGLFIIIFCAVGKTMFKL